MLKALENDKSSKRKEKRKEKEKDFVEALVMEKESEETVTGGKVNKKRMQKKQTNLHKRQDKMNQDKKKQVKNVMKATTTRRPLKHMRPMMLSMQPQQKKRNMKITSQQPMSHMLRMRKGKQAHLSARE